MTKKIFIFLFITIFFCLCSTVNVNAADLNDLLKKQQDLKFLKDEDLSNLVFFSEYDLNYDKKLYYNPVAREIVKKIDIADSHCEKSNVSVAFYEYQNLIKKMQPNDFFYMTMAYKLSQIGFFSLAHNAMMKVQDKEIWGQHIDYIRKHCFPVVNLKITEEVFFAGLLSDIIYNNMTDECLLRLEKDGKFLKDLDYTKYISAEAYFAEKNYKDALSQINKAIYENPDNIFYKKLKAEILDAAGKEKEAIHVINQINNTDVVFTDIQKDIDKVKYHSLSKIEKNEIKQKYYLAYYFYLNKDYSRAINELKLLIMKGENKYSPELLGKIYEITEKPDEAFRLYNKQIAKNKKNAYAHKGLGDIYLAEKNYAQAFEEYKLANKFQKNDIENLTALTVVSYKLNDKKAAKKYVDKMLKTQPNNFKALYLNSKINEDIGNINLKLSISQNPIYAGGWLDLASLALSSNDLVSAEEYINAAAYITYKSPRYFYYKSLLNTSKKDYETASTDIKRAENIIKEQNQLTEVYNEHI